MSHDLIAGWRLLRLPDVLPGPKFFSNHSEESRGDCKNHGANEESDHSECLYAAQHGKKDQQRVKLDSPLIM